MALRSVLKKPEKLITCRQCGNAWPKSKYYSTCYRGIGCLALPGGNPSNQPGEEPPLKISRSTELNTLQSILKGHKDGPATGEPRRRLSEASNYEQAISATRNLLMRSGQTNQVADHMRAGAGPAPAFSKVTEGNQQVTPETSATSSFDPLKNMTQSEVEHGAAALHCSSFEDTAHHHYCEEAVDKSDQVAAHTFEEDSGCEKDGTEQTESDYGDEDWNKASASDQSSEDAELRMLEAVKMMTAKCRGFRSNRVQIWRKRETGEKKKHSRSIQMR
jgi:hypothetical protein